MVSVINIDSNELIEVTDPDEEVFLLYTSLASLTAENLGDTSFRGLGAVNTKEDILTIVIDLDAPGNNTSTKATAKRRTRAINREFYLYQDKTALRSRAGDTGSVLWQASLDLVKLLMLQECNRSMNQLFRWETLATSHVMELGAGTGLLAIALAPYVRRYTATDVPALLPLIEKNGKLNGLDSNKVSIEECDWQLLHAMTPTIRARYCSLDSMVDLLLIVDCVFNPALLPPLVSAINSYTTPQYTTVLVVIELRAEDVVRDFLDLWLQSGTWRIWRMNLLSFRYAVWIASKMSMLEQVST